MVDEGVRLGTRVIVASGVWVGVDNGILGAVGTGRVGSGLVSPGAVAGRLHPTRA